jgi:Lamin Tail Domain/Protein of unknown function (DUF1524)
MTRHKGSAIRPGRRSPVKPQAERSVETTVTRCWERFRSLPVWAQIVPVLLAVVSAAVFLAISISSSGGNGQPGAITAHGATPGAATPSSTVAPGAPSTTTTVGLAPAPTSSTGATAPASTTTTATASSGQSELSRLHIAPEGPRTGYDRSLFPLWIDADHDGCDARHEVLIAESVVPAHVGAGCAVSGEWHSAYDGVTTTDASSFDIDHVVPLAEAWDSGASGWDPARRRDYANDLDHPETLRAVSAASNRAKGDDDPAAWKPPLRSDWCNYADDWISVKVTWNLTADPAEVNGLRGMLDTCGASGAPASQPTPTPTSTTTTMNPASPANGAPASGMTVSSLDCAGETVTVTNGGSVPAGLTGWSIHDEGANHTYRFAAGYTLAPGVSATVRSGGPPGPGELAWTNQNVWNNTGDTAYLVNAAGTVMSTRSC